jgi:hypothetical protein
MVRGGLRDGHLSAKKNYTNLFLEWQPPKLSVLSFNHKSAKYCRFAHLSL